MAKPETTSTKSDSKHSNNKAPAATVAAPKNEAPVAAKSNVVPLSASEKHVGAPLNSKVEGARVRTGAKGVSKAYLPPIATRRKMLTFACTLATKTSKRLKKWTAEKAEFGAIAKQVDAAIVQLQSAMMDLDKLPQNWEPTKTIASVNVGGFSLGDIVRIREKRQSQYADVLDAESVKMPMKVSKIGKSKIVVDLGGGKVTVITKSHLVPNNKPIEEERAEQAKIDQARKDKAAAAATEASTAAK